MTSASAAASTEAIPRPIQYDQRRPPTVVTRDAVQDDGKDNNYLRLLKADFLDESMGHTDQNEIMNKPPIHENGVMPTAQEELPPLQVNGQLDDNDRLEPVADDDPASYNLVTPAQGEKEEFSLEKASEILFSKDHLQVIFADSAFLLKFTSFLGQYRPKSVPLLVHYLDSLKSLRAIHYANAICEGLDPVVGLDFTQQTIKPTINTFLETRANAAFDILVRDELPAFITHQYIQIVSKSISARITGMLSPHLREASEGLAEVFCLTDPSRQDNPIVFASEGTAILYFVVWM